MRLGLPFPAEIQNQLRVEANRPRWNTVATEENSTDQMNKPPSPSERLHHPHDLRFRPLFPSWEMMTRARRD